MLVMYRAAAVEWPVSCTTLPALTEYHQVLVQMSSWSAEAVNDHSLSCGNVASYSSSLYSPGFYEPGGH